MTTRSLLLTGLLACSLACADDRGNTDEGNSSEATDEADGTSNTSATTAETTDTATTDSTTDTADTTTTDTTSDTTDTTSDTTSDTTDTTSDTTDTTTDTTDTTESGETGMGMCAPQDASCANGELCCDGLMCCQGVPVPPGAEFCSNNCPISDRNLKREFAAVNQQEILAKLVAMPITTWTYKHDDGHARHIGPMAQDFAAAFEVGASDRMIFQIDADGVSFAAIQALNAQVEELEAENAALEAKLETLEARLEKLESPAR